MDALVITTESGSRHLLDLEAKTYARLPEGGEALRRDCEELTVLEVGPLTVGSPLFLLLAPLGEGAVATLRMTSPVVAYTSL